LQLIAIFLTAISIALIMSPAAYHRIVEPEIGSEFFVRFTSALIACAMVPLMISLTLDAYIVAILVVRSVVISAAIAICVFAPPARCNTKACARPGNSNGPCAGEVTCIRHDKLPRTKSTQLTGASKTPWHGSRKRQRSAVRALPTFP
jgi:hypothetical protein